MGFSGVGKSTLINSLIGEGVQRVNEIRQSDGRGKHTTTHKELVTLPSGGLIIDTPGMRELQVLEVDQGLNNLYEDIIQLAEQCKFNDCLHRHEPDFAVQEAIEFKKSGLGGKYILDTSFHPIACPLHLVSNYFVHFLLVH